MTFVPIQSPRTDTAKGGRGATLVTLADTWKEARFMTDGNIQTLKKCCPLIVIFYLQLLITFFILLAN